MSDKPLQRYRRSIFSGRAAAATIKGCGFSEKRTICEFGMREIGTALFSKRDEGLRVSGSGGKAILHAMKHNPHESPTVDGPDDESKAVRRTRPASTSLICALIGLMLAGLFPCTGGYLDVLALSVTFPTAVCGWYAATTVHRDSLSHAILTLVICVLATIIFLKNLADVLWFGHHAVWPV